MNKGYVIAIAVAMVLVGGGLIYWYSMQGSSYSPPASYQTPTSSPMDTNTSSTPNSAPASAAVTIGNFAFSPATLTIHKGATVTWTNNDGVPHTVTGDNGGPTSSALGQGQSYSYTFNTVGSFPYHCSIHPSMKATVQVVN